MKVQSVIVTTNLKLVLELSLNVIKYPQPHIKHTYPRAHNSVNCGPSLAENVIKISLSVLHKQIKKMGREKSRSEYYSIFKVS